jgi:fluoride exporter
MQLQFPPAVAVGLGAIAGALSRYYLTLWFTQRFGTTFPYGTGVINLTGCVLMGLIATLALNERLISPELRLLLTTGFLGAYTTFSSYGLETVGLLNRSLWAQAAFYWVGSAVLGIVGIQVGMAIGRGLMMGR